jgi:TIGR03009 family protein
MMRSAAFARFALFTLLAWVGAVAVSRARTSATPGAPPAAAPADAAKLDAHLAAWEKAAGGLTTVHVEVTLTRKDGVRQKAREFTGSALCMRPTYARLRLADAAAPNDYEAFICNGKAVYAYDGPSRTVTEHKLPDPKADPAGATDNLVIDFLFGPTAKAFKDRFAVRLLGEDADYVYLEVKPRLAKDKQEFQELRMALHGPKSKTPYLPAQIITHKPNADTEDWKFTKPQTNVTGIGAKDFEYVKVEGFTFRKAPQQPAPRR